MRANHIWKDTSDMYMDFNAFVNVISSNEYISMINFDYALENSFFLVLAIKLEVSNLTMDCLCAGNRN